MTNTSDAQELLMQNAHASRELERRKEALPYLAQEFVDRALFEGHEPDNHRRFDAFFWEIGETTQIIHRKSRDVILMVDDEGGLWMVYYINRRLPFHGRIQIRKRIRPLWCSSRLIDACYEALRP